MRNGSVSPLLSFLGSGPNTFSTLFFFLLHIVAITTTKTTHQTSPICGCQHFVCCPIPIPIPIPFYPQFHSHTVMNERGAKMWMKRIQTEQRKETEEERESQSDWDSYRLPSSRCVYIVTIFPAFRGKCLFIDSPPGKPLTYHHNSAPNGVCTWCFLYPKPEYMNSIKE